MHFFTQLLSAGNLVAGECLAKHCDERTVAGKEDRVCWLVQFASTSRYIQPYQSLPCSRHTGNETNELAVIGQLETRRKFIKQVAGTSAALAIGPHIVGSAVPDQVTSTTTPAATSDLLKVNLKINGIWQMPFFGIHGHFLYLLS